MEVSNIKLAKILRNIAAVYTIKGIGNIFQIRAYQTAADSIEHSTSEIQDLWEEEKLDQVPALGASIRGYLDELFKTGKVKHFEQIQKNIPPLVFELLDIPGVGPKTALKVTNLGVKDLESLQKGLKNGVLVSKGLSAKIAQNIMSGLHEVSMRGNRMLLPYAAAQADRILIYLKKNPYVLSVHPLGSLRRMAVTIGDLDFSIASDHPKEVIEYFCKMPRVVRVLDKGDFKATVILQSGIQVDLLVGNLKSYGALLQHFTGSKNHNIHLRFLANKKGYSLSEYGVRKVSSGKIIQTETEEEFYKLLGMGCSISPNKGGYRGD